MKTRLITIIIFSVVGFLLLVPIFLLGIIVGPQGLHYYNMAIMGTVIFGVLFNLVGISYRDFKKTENIALFIVAIFTITAFSLFSKFWIDNRYGYGNWNFKNAWTMYFDQEETNIKWTNYNLEVLKDDIIKFYSINGKYPINLRELPEKNGYRELQDTWNEDIKYYKTPEKIILTSSGPDKKLNTEDDLVVEIKN